VIDYADDSTLKAAGINVKQIVFLAEIKMPYPNFSFSGDKSLARVEPPRPLPNALPIAHPGRKHEFSPLQGNLPESRRLRLNF
jgi:hypothetical protein